MYFPAADGIIPMIRIYVAVIDGIMPRLDGLGVLERLQKTEEDDRPITIILSALSQDKVVQKALDLGASYYMVKPFDMDALTQRIRQLMQEQKPLLKAIAPVRTSSGGSQRSASGPEHRRIIVLSSETASFHYFGDMP